MSELATLRVEDLELEAGRLHAIGKGDKERELPVIPRLAAILREYLTEVRPALMDRPLRGWLQRSNRIWRGGYQVGGRQASFSTGTAGRAEAERILREHVTDLRLKQVSPSLFLRTGPTGAYCRQRAQQPLRTRSLYRAIRQRCSLVLGRPVHSHALRHSFARGSESTARRWSWSRRRSATPS